MNPIHYLLYYESFSLRDLCIHTFRRHLPDSLVYELQEEKRLLAASSSGYFEFAIFLVDTFQEKHIEILKKMFFYKQNMPILVVANYYEKALYIQDLKNQQNLYFLFPNEIADIPGISLRILKHSTYYKRQHIRKKSGLNLELGFDEETKTKVQIKNMSEGGVQFLTRIELTKNECPYIYHRTLKGHNITIPIQILWRTQESDGRWKYGAKYLSLT